ncbi:MAG: hypothetical protein HY788_17770 [Deltaproteobacteria bacterium]|nr:hypothetical protein [Deltaproteobacteria bacterium]
MKRAALVKRLTLQARRFVMPGVFLIGFLLWFLNLTAAASHARQTPDPDSTWFVDMNLYAESAHASLTCEKCHGTMVKDGREHPDLKDPEELRDSATRTFDYTRCKSCHKVACERAQQGAHAKALTEETGRAVPSSDESTGAKKKAPTCGDCHSSHYTPSGLSRLDNGRRMADVCGSCHEAQWISYLDNYHGRTAVFLGDEKSAFCSDCHGAHDVISLKKRDAALGACARCHPQASEEFTAFVIHDTLESLPEKELEKQKTLVLIHRVKIIAFVVVALVLVLFFGHTFLWILRELHEKLRKQ